jgi:hypothetical protein
LLQLPQPARRVSHWYNKMWRYMIRLSDSIAL